MIYKCDCKSDSKGNTSAAEFQDAKLGTGNRYYTSGPTDGTKARCTVCGKQK